MATDKKFSLNLPLKVILTEEGASHFISHKMKLLRFKLADNIEEYGVSLNPFSPQALQNMILLNYVSKIEISMTEFVSVRQEVMDLSKTLVYSILYKQFDRQLFADFIQTDVVQKHNRKNPTQLIDERINISETQLRRALVSLQPVVQRAKKEILDPIWKSIMDNKDYSLEEKNIYLLMTEKFLNRLSLMNWYIITKFYKSDGFSQITIAIRHLVQVYMEKSRVAEYISILVMELALNSENSNMRKEAQRMFAGIEDIDSLLYDPEQRAKIVEELKRNHEQVFVSWKIGGGSSAIGKQGRLQITLYNKNDQFQEIKESIESKAAADTNKKSLIDFYRELPEGQESTDLGLYYLSYLDDACKRVNVKFESIVNQFSSSDLTVINLIFNF
ncbi:hypothetical protein [Treponema pectinovorum]|uniref:hypothetical protein n=1 Tax=Treponema pectinovorum TaxID=164 RepID=UPI0011CC4061|nr:hypothetical protein [Treponema pectinovorum]